VEKYLERLKVLPDKDRNVLLVMSDAHKQIAQLKAAGDLYAKT
jgi:hypothetical protein